MRAYERLVKYSAYPTASDETSDTCPSSPAQLDFGKVMAEEMKQIGMSDISIDENGYVFGTVESTIENYSGKVLGFVVHMDVVHDVPYENIKTHVLENYDGGDIVLNKELGIVMSPEKFPVLSRYKGKSLLLTDGTTLMGADNKAGIAEVMTMAETLINHPEIKHGKIRIGLTPDEEIGRGATLFDVKRFGADFAYTCDGAAFGEVSYETFNAASLLLKVDGKNIHPGDAKNKMKNAMLIAMEFDSLLPENEKPEYTENYEGFYHLTQMEGIVEEARLHYILRDHDMNLLERRKYIVRKAVEYLNEKYGEGTVIAEITDSYKNMAEKILPYKELIDIPYAAIRELGAEPFTKPMRGGTDGSTLSYMGLPCPNLGTGSHNHHGKTEFAVIEDMDKCVEMLVKITEKFAKM